MCGIMPSVILRNVLNVESHFTLPQWEIKFNIVSIHKTSYKKLKYNGN